MTDEWMAVDIVRKFVPDDYYAGKTTGEGAIFGWAESWLTDVTTALREAIEEIDRLKEIDPEFLWRAVSELNPTPWEQLLVPLPPPEPPKPANNVWRVVRPGVGGMLDSEVVRWETASDEPSGALLADGTLQVAGIVGGRIGAPWRLQRYQIRDSGDGHYDYWRDVAEARRS